MDYTEKTYTNLIAKFINGNFLEQINYNKVDLKKLIELSKIHRNPGIVYSSMKMDYKNCPLEYLQVFEKGFYGNVLKYSKQISVLEILKREFNNNTIKNIVIKGISISKYYPQPELRTMSDIDFIIDKKYFKRVMLIMNKLQAKFYYDRSNDSVLFFNYKTVNIEVHDRLVKEDIGDNKSPSQYFKDYRNYVIKTDENSYELKGGYQLIYIIYHMAKHFNNSGCGVRMFTDLAFILNKYGDTIKIKELYIQLNKIGLDSFAEKTIYICNKWFGTKFYTPVKQFSGIEKVEEYVLTAGVFGYENLNSDVSRINKNGKGSYKVLLLKWLFPSYKIMKQHSEWFKNKPAILLPLAYIERLRRNAKERGGIIKWLKSINKGKQQIIHHSNILETMGLKE